MHTITSIRIEDHRTGSQENWAWKGPREVSSSTSCSEKGEPWAQTRLLRAWCNQVSKTCRDRDYNLAEQLVLMLDYPYYENNFFCISRTYREQYFWTLEGTKLPSLSTPAVSVLAKLPLISLGYLYTGESSLDRQVEREGLFMWRRSRNCISAASTWTARSPVEGNAYPILASLHPRTSGYCVSRAVLWAKMLGES